MNVAELKKLLEEYPDDLQVVIERHGSFTFLDDREFAVVCGIHKGSWIMATYVNMSAEDKASRKQYLRLVDG